MWLKWSDQHGLEACDIHFAHLFEACLFLRSMIHVFSLLSLNHVWFQIHGQFTEQQIHGILNFYLLQDEEKYISP